MVESVATALGVSEIAQAFRPKGWAEKLREALEEVPVAAMAGQRDGDEDSAEETIIVD